MHSEEPGAVRKIVIADDNEDFLASFQILLEAAGYDVYGTRSGCAAIRLTQVHRLHAIIVDIHLPDVSGYEIAKHVRADESRADTLLIAITGWTQPRVADTAHAAGFDHCLLKPVDFAQLESLLRRRNDRRSDRHV